MQHARTNAITCVIRAAARLEIGESVHDDLRLQSVAAERQSVSGKREERGKEADARATRVTTVPTAVAVAAVAVAAVAAAAVAAAAATAAAAPAAAAAAAA
jgi:hypothetical protein